jgi:AraC family transcriptional regulator
MTQLITPAELPKWVPGQKLGSSEGLGWQGISLTSYHYEPSDVVVPPLSEFVVVAYRHGHTGMQRRFEGRWTRTHCEAGDVSLLTRCQGSHWHWTEGIDVSHAYLSEDFVARIAAEVLERPIAELRLHDLLKVRDPFVTTIVEDIAREAHERALGCGLYVQTLATQLVVHLLRRYTAVAYRDDAPPGGLSPAQCRLLTEYIETRLHEAMNLEELAGVAGLGTWTFGRRFRESFGASPHAYVVNQRVARAERLLAQGSQALKAVASACGFADQAHMTRVLHGRLGKTPSAVRRGALN